MSHLARVVRTLPWTDPMTVAAGLAHQDGALCLLSDGGPNGRTSYVAADPDRVEIGPLDPGTLATRLAGADRGRQWVGLLSYDAGARAATGTRSSAAGDWPDVMLARYPALLAFDHADQTVSAIGLGANEIEAGALAERAAAWIGTARSPATPGPPAVSMDTERDPEAYRQSVRDVVDRIAAGELFQANIARAWGGGLIAGGDPFDVFLRLAQAGSPYGAFWRMGDRALVSQSPELFLSLDPGSGRIETRPIKGTRARHPDSVVDAALAARLLASEKDRAENLMIVDLMRNDLARTSVPGSVRVERLFALETFPTVHHLVSTVTAQAAPGVGPGDLLAATFPPGSITGAPKHQAMKVIADHEAPRGPWCGTLFILDEVGRMTASVLIRTLSFWRQGSDWRFRTLAGAGIVADSDPDAELEETEAKIAAIRIALTGAQR